MKYPLNVTSEIGVLRTVLLHRPGREVENLTPDTLERLLFDDIPFLPVVQKEHDYFASTLQNRGIEVLYLEKLVSETLSTDELRKQFINQILSESKLSSTVLEDQLREYLITLSADKLVDTVMVGIQKKEMNFKSSNHLSEMMLETNPFYMDPMPNLYFTRDPAAVIGNGISINRMNRVARQRESLFLDYIIKYHPRFAKANIPIWFDRTASHPMEGGDQLVLSSDVIAIGVSDRTSPQAIEEMAVNIFENQKDIKKVLAIEIPKKRAFMHLDTVFTMVDYDKFTIHPEIQGEDGSMNIYILEKGKEKGSCTITRKTDLFATLKDVLKLKDVALIPCGGGDPIAAAREQWNDGSNTLAIAPGVVVTYDRNYVSNSVIRSYGVEVVEVLSSELSRGRGGPRCMSMPINRDNL